MSILFVHTGSSSKISQNSIDLECPATKFEVKPIVSAIQEQVEEDTFNERLYSSTLGI